MLAEEASAGGVEHGSLLPAALLARVPKNEKLVLNLVLSYLETEKLPASLLVNGGYVRDLLLGKTPDDLDLSLCLKECPPDVTIDSVLQGLSTFAKARPDLNVSSVNVTTILSDTSKNKNVDTAKADMVVGVEHERIEVDFMPTIGDERCASALRPPPAPSSSADEEVEAAPLHRPAKAQRRYDDYDRVPTRDVRGTPEEDALRRDLTIGAMLLEISRPAAEITAADGGATSASASPAPASAGTSDALSLTIAAAESLQWRLLDFYGGLADLSSGTLRSPYPANKRVAEVWDEVLRTPEEQLTARALGLRQSPSAVDESSGTLQIVWWVKVLKDDPLRLLRALRFTAKFGFELHGTFWFAAPFALAPLQSKVAGSRKNTELLKIAKAGRQPLLGFMALAFGQSVADPARLPPTGFEAALMVAAVNELPSSLSEDEALGTALAAAAYACRGPWGGEEPVDADAAADGSAGAASGVPMAGVDESDAAAAAAASEAHAQITAACDGLCASNELRSAAEMPLLVTAALLSPPEPLGVHRLFERAVSSATASSSAAAAGSGSGAGAGAGASASEVEGREFAALVHMWDTLRLEKFLQGKAGAGVQPHFNVALASTRCSQGTREALGRRLEQLLVPGVSINGKALVGIPRLPNHLRGSVISLLHVVARLRGTPDLHLSAPEQLTHFLEVECGGLLSALYDEWYDESAGGELRPAYAPPSKGPKPKARKGGGGSKEGDAS